MSNVIIDFTARLNKKRQNEALKELIVASGWDIDGEVSSVNSDICFYLIDSVEPGKLIFGCKKDSIPHPNSSEVVHWGHFVLAWNVFADPKMAYDDKHMDNTMELVLRALPSLPEWPKLQKNALSIEAGKKAHILVVVDKNNLDAPHELIVAHSESPVLNAESIQSIVDSYINSQ
jgi:hypothetical protein